MITVECRDHRKGKQDDRWIEQLVTKREKIGASLTVAVSSSGFSESAIISAKHFGIALRRLDEITDAEIAQEWAGLSKFKIEVLESQFHATDIALFGLNNTPITPDQLRPDLLHRLRSDLTFTKFLISRGDDPPISAADLGRMVNAPYLEKTVILLLLLIPSTFMMGGTLKLLMDHNQFLWCRLDFNTR